MDKSKLGEIIRDRRVHAANKSLRQLARDARISPGYLSQIENGKIKNPSDEVLESIAQMLGWTYETLIEEAK